MHSPSMLETPKNYFQEDNNPLLIIQIGKITEYFFILSQCYM